jgi:hypothetical protein
MAIEDDLRYLMKAAGQGEPTRKQLKEFRKKLENAYVDITLNKEADNDGKKKGR